MLASPKHTLYRLRLTLGLMGLFFPFLVWWIHYDNLYSISHYYYTKAALVYIGFMFSFGLILFCYTGHPKKTNEKLSDNLITNMAGLCAILTMLIPTGSHSAMGKVDFIEAPYLFGYAKNDTSNLLHNFFAIGFITLLGFMAFNKFTKTHKTNRIPFYKFSAWTIWISIILIIILVGADKLFFKERINQYIPGPGYVFWLEGLAIEAFALSWLLKSWHPEDFFKNK